jgi:hypothetical protein
MRRKPFCGVTNLKFRNLQVLQAVGGAHGPKRVSKSLKFTFLWHSHVGRTPKGHAKGATNLVGLPLATRTHTIKCHEHKSGNQLPGSRDPAKQTELVLNRRLQEIHGHTKATSKSLVICFPGRPQMPRRLNGVILPGMCTCLVTRSFLDTGCLGGSLLPRTRVPLIPIAWRFSLALLDFICLVILKVQPLHQSRVQLQRDQKLLLGG